MNNQNLRPREPLWGATKKKRHPFMTDEAWAGWQELAGKLDCSVSEVMERVGRGAVTPEEFQKISQWLLTSSK